MKILMEEKTLLLFKLGGEEFALDVAQIYEILSPQPIHHLPQAPDFLEGVISLRGRIIAVLDLSKKFQVKFEEDPSGKRFIVCRVGKFVMSLIVDCVIEVISLNVNFITPGDEFLAGIVQHIPVTGVARYGERVVPILDLEKILSEEERAKLSQTAS
jgi:purine-binding chemotaxis protein CheW